MNKEKDEANLYNEIGLRYGSQCNYQEALVWYEKSMKIKEKIGNLAGLATTYNNIGGIYYAEGKYQEALKWGEKSKEIQKRIGDKTGLALS
ncbi:MAG: tetratricopeptide repeat protein [bacterium]|nr:tetratricopeptide repeat protein [bacterium]